MHSLFCIHSYELNIERDYIGRLLLNITWDEWSRGNLIKPGWLWQIKDYRRQQRFKAQIKA